MVPKIFAERGLCLSVGHKARQGYSAVICGAPFSRPSAKRRYKNQKFGFGGKKKGSKWNTRESYDDVSSFRAKVAHGKGPRKPGKKGANVSEGSRWGPSQSVSTPKSAPLGSFSPWHRRASCMLTTFDFFVCLFCLCRSAQESEQDRK